MTTQAETFNTADSDTLGPGLSWTEEEGDIDIVSNRARIISISGGTGHPRAYPGALSTDDHLVKAVVRTSNNSDSEGLGVMVRKSNSAKTYYHIDLYHGSGCRVWSCEAGAFTSLGDVATTINNNTDYTLVAMMRDSTLVTYVDGVAKHTITNSAITGNVRGGIVGAIDSQSPPTSNLEWDSFNAQDLPITLVGTGAEASAASGGITLNAPSGTPANDDIWLAFIHSSDQVAHTLTDWTEIVQGNGGGTTSRLSVWYHRYAGSTPNLVVGHTAGQSPIGGIISLRGCKTSGSPVNVASSINGGTDASIEHNTVTPNVDGCVLLVVNGSADDNNRTVPSGYANMLEDSGGGTQGAYVTTAGNPDGSVSVFMRDVLNGTATGTITITQAAADAWASVLIAIEPQATANAYTLDCQPGSFSVTGVAGTLLAARMINAAPGSFSITGFDASLVHGFVINAEPGQFDITGIDATFLYNRIMIADPGAFTISGTAASLLAGYMLNAAPGSFSITGVDANLAKGYFIIAEPGEFVITGFDATFLYNRVLNAEPGSLVITGVASSLLAGYVLNAEPGTFEVTGADAALLADRIIDAGPGTFLITGSAASTVAGYLLVADPGSYSITGVDGTLVVTSAGAFVLIADPGEFSIVGEDGNLVFTEAEAEKGYITLRKTISAIVMNPRKRD